MVGSVVGGYFGFIGLFTVIGQIFCQVSMLQWVHS